MICSSESTDATVSIPNLAVPLPHARPTSIYECYDLLNKTLGRDSLLVKGLENRNFITVDDVITGTGTEDIRETRMRQSLAIALLPAYLTDINRRNVKQLGPGLVNLLLSLETETDEDGVPIEAEEVKMTALIGRVIHFASKADPLFLTLMVDKIVPNDELLFYTKYTFLKSIRSIFSPEVSLVPSPRIDEVSLRFLPALIDSTSKCIERQFTSAIRSKTPNPFTHELLLVELINTKLVLFEKSKNDIDIIIPLVFELSKKLTPESSNHLVNAFMRLLLASPHVLLEIVEEDIGPLKRVLGIFLTNKKVTYDSIVIETAESIFKYLS